MNRHELMLGLAWGITIAAAALSVFLIVVGSGVSEASVSAQCSAGNQCVYAGESRSYLVPEPAAIVPLTMVMLVASGLIAKRMLLAWSGTAALLFFSILTGFSIGLFYIPLVTALIGLLAVIQGQHALSPKLRS